MELRLSDLPKARDIELDSIWVDSMYVSARTDIDLVTIWFGTAILDSEPQVMKESVRVATSKSHVIRMIDVLCRMSGYYPEKPKTDDQSAKAEK